MDGIPQHNPEQLSHALGEAVVRIWGGLPQPVQQHLFEEVITSRGEDLRARLAAFLHEHHPRTSATIKARAMLEPDSLGG
jgi:hypothetical protein